MSADDWNAACVLSEWAIRSDDRQAIAPAHGNLVELYLLALMMKPGGHIPEPAKARTQAIAHLEKLIAICELTDLQLKYRYFHLHRFAHWFKKKTLGREMPIRVSELAEELFEMLPKELHLAIKAGE